MTETAPSSGAMPESRDDQEQQQQPQPTTTTTTTVSSPSQPPKLQGALEMDDLSKASLAKEDGTAVPSNGENDGAAAAATAVAENSSPNDAEPTVQSDDQSTKAKEPPSTAEQEPMAIGPADSSEESVKGEPVIEIMLIVTSSNTRHPFKIHEKYLRRRNVNVTALNEEGKMDITSITVYTLKELILRDWRQEWEAAPREPTSIRLIRMGKLLEDKSTLKSKSFTRRFC